MSPQTDDLQAWLQNLGGNQSNQPSKPPPIKKPKAKIKTAKQVKAKQKQQADTPSTTPCENDVYDCVENAQAEAQDVSAYHTDNDVYASVEIDNDVHSAKARFKKKDKTSVKNLFSAGNLKNAIIIQEVLGKPKALR